MDKLKQWVVLTLVAVLVVLAAGWMLLISPKHSVAADLHTQAGEQMNQNAALQTQLAVLKAQAKDLPKQRAKLTAVAAKIPDNPALPALVRDLTKAATTADIELVSIVPTAPEPVTAGAVTTPVAGGASAAAAPGLSTIKVTLAVVGGYFQIEQFLNGLEDLSRAVKVTGVTMALGESTLKPLATGAVNNGGTLTASITGNVYMATGRPAATPTLAGALR